MKHYVIAVMTLMLTATSLAIDEPNWPERKEYWETALEDKFKPPTVGQNITISLTSGKSKDGILRFVGNTSIKLALEGGTVEYPRTSLHPRTRAQLYKDEFIAYWTNDRLSKEKAVYQKQKQEEEIKERDAQKRQELQSSLQSAILVLEDWSWKTEHGYAIVDGQVKNISLRPLQNVQAVARFYSSSGDFITSDSALIEYRPLLPGQSSPFKIYAPANPAMRSARIGFTTFGGGTISYMDKQQYNRIKSELDEL